MSYSSQSLNRDLKHFSHYIKNLLDYSISIVQIVSLCNDKFNLPTFDSCRLQILMKIFTFAVTLASPQIIWLAESLTPSPTMPRNMEIYERVPFVTYIGFRYDSNIENSTPKRVIWASSSPIEVNFDVCGKSYFT